MDLLKLLDPSVHHTASTMPIGKRPKTNGVATAAMLIRIASEMLETSPTLRKRMGITLSDLAAADKVRKELTRRSLAVQ
ncbi:hypothetical protein [Fibrella forsythiae]|uniref:Uncharacterized protein n=1 Tax=Fibrella forsythiae TaxID=2817061 RepID=A0ABS3JHI8_9BACT|nr:hypothetical protein [Fibrella forsythiae]MBO0949430.1 hypothetical protein [Fibrella forsythiae]